MNRLNKLNSLNILEKSAGSVSPYWNPLKPLGGETPDFWVKENSRSGLTLTDSVNVVNSPTILPAYFSQLAANQIYSSAATPGLDIGNGNFTFATWMRQDDPNAAAINLVGRQVGSNASGTLLLWTNGTDFKYRTLVRTSDASYAILSSAIAKDLLPHLHVLEIDQMSATHTLKYSIDGVQQGVTTTITGTFGGGNYAYKFGLAGTCSYSDTYIFDRILSTADKSALFERRLVTGARAHWSFLGSDGSYEYDSSGNGYHLTGANITVANYLYGSMGSRHGLDVGYSVYHKIADDVKIYVPYSDNGVPLVSPPVPATYTKGDYWNGDLEDIAGDLSNHNLANSSLLFVDAIWDRSDVTIYSSLARVAGTRDYQRYLSGTPKQWHITQISKDVIDYFSNDNYKNKKFPKVYPNSAYDRQLLKELFAYSTVKVANDLKKVLIYTGDNDWYHTIDYEFTTTNIRAQRDSKILAYNTTTKTLYLSLDCGVTYPISLNLSSISGVFITDAWIFGNGNITFATHNKQFLSTDNLSTYAETNVLDENGNLYRPAYGAGSFNMFRPIQQNIPTYVGDMEIRIWGSYSLDPGTFNVNTRAWCTIDSGVTIRSVYKCGVTNPPLQAGDHIHGLFFEEGNNIAWLYTGDVNTGLIKGTYNVELNTFSWESIAAGGVENTFMMVGFHIVDGKMFWGSDSTGLYKPGMFRGDASNLLDTTKYRRLPYINYTIPVVYPLRDGNLILASRKLTKNLLISTNGGKYFMHHFPIGDAVMDPTYGGYINPRNKNANGYYVLDIYESGESLTSNGWEQGIVLMVKVIPI